MIATHDQGVIAVVHPGRELARRGGRPAAPNTFVHEIEIGDVDGDGVAGVLRHAEQAEQARPGAARRGAHVQAHADRAGRSRSSTRRATRTPRRSSPPTSTATASPSSTSSWEGAVGAGRHARAAGHRQAVPLEGRQARTAPSSPRCPIARCARSRRATSTATARSTSSRARCRRASGCSSRAPTAGRGRRSTPRRRASSIPVHARRPRRRRRARDLRRLRGPARAPPVPLEGRQLREDGRDAARTRATSPGTSPTGSSDVRHARRSLRGI